MLTNKLPTPERYRNIPFLASGPTQDYTRDAQIIGELRKAEDCQVALREATAYIGKLLGLKSREPIGYNTAVFLAFGMKKKDADEHPESKLLNTRGSYLPLYYCDEPLSNVEAQPKTTEKSNVRNIRG